MRVADILHGKGATVQTVSQDATVRDVLALLAEHNIGALVVTADGQAVAGIVSERDIVRCLHQSADAMDEPVSSIMTPDVATSEPTASVDELMRLMTDRRIRHVPVVSAGRLAGIVSIGDVVKSRIRELEFEREQLSTYISG